MKLYQAIGPFSPTHLQIPRFEKFAGPRRGIPPRDVAFLTIKRLLEGNIIVNLPGWVLPSPFPPISEVGEFAAELSDLNGRLLTFTRFDVPEHIKSRSDDKAHF